MITPVGWESENISDKCIDGGPAMLNGTKVKKSLSGTRRYYRYPNRTTAGCAYPWFNKKWIRS